jgi:hypothetical protein
MGIAFVACPLAGCICTRVEQALASVAKRCRNFGSEPISRHRHMTEPWTPHPPHFTNFSSYQPHTSLQDAGNDWRSGCTLLPRKSDVMLRISYSQTEARQQWMLCGQLAGPWVEELRSCWHTLHNAVESRALVDLSDVTFIDENGERLLSEMRDAGVAFVAAGVETRYLLENLNSNSERPLRRLVGCLSNVSNPCGGPQLIERRNQGEKNK